MVSDELSEDASGALSSPRTTETAAPSEISLTSWLMGSEAWICTIGPISGAQASLPGANITVLASKGVEVLEMGPTLYCWSFRSPANPAARPVSAVLLSTATLVWPGGHARSEPFWPPPLPVDSSSPPISWVAAKPTPASRISAPTIITAVDGSAGMLRSPSSPWRRPSKRWRRSAAWRASSARLKASASVGAEAAAARAAAFGFLPAVACVSPSSSMSSGWVGMGSPSTRNSAFSRRRRTSRACMK